MTSPPPEPSPFKGTVTGPAIAIAVVALIAAISISWSLYGKQSASGNSQSAAACSGAAAIARRIAPLAKGEIAALQVPASPKPAVEVSFNSPEGKPLKLADFRGRTILLNLWATWCAPCRQEMPALDRLQQTLGSEKFEVVAVNIDTTRLERPKQFLAEVKVEKLAYYNDASANVFQDLKRAGKAFGMPTTLLIDPSGCEIGNLAGPAEWASEDALALMRAALAGG